MADVVNFPGSTTAEGVLHIIRRLTEIAEENNLTDIAISAVQRDGAIITAFHADKDVLMLMGGIQVLNRRVLDSISE